MSHEQFLVQHLSEMVTEATKGIVNGSIKTLASIETLEGILNGLSDEEKRAFYSGLKDITNALFLTLEQVRKEAEE